MLFFRRKSTPSAHSQEYLDALVTSIRRARSRLPIKKASLHAFTEDEYYPGLEPLAESPLSMPDGEELMQEAVPEELVSQEGGLQEAVAEELVARDAELPNEAEMAAVTELETYLSTLKPLPSTENCGDENSGDIDRPNDQWSFSA